MDEHIVDTNLGLVQCCIGVSWQNEGVRWHCPRGILLALARGKARRD